MNTQWFKNLFYSFPVQLFFLHFRKYQVLLLFWLLLFSTIQGGFLKSYGANSLFLAPEYLGSVNVISSAITGMSIGMFIMSWNITSFVLFSRYFRFLAATTNPLLKYCINNTLLPAIFLVFYAVYAARFGYERELLTIPELLLLGAGFLGGLLLFFSLSFLYLFGANKSIVRSILPLLNDPANYLEQSQQKESVSGRLRLTVLYYLDSFFSVKPVRSVQHYNRLFIDTVFKRYHVAAIIAVLLAFLALLIAGFLMDEPLFQLPAAASVTIFLAILIGVAGAITYFLQSWTIPVLVVVAWLLNLAYQWNWVDFRNKAYGLSYSLAHRPQYSDSALQQLASKGNMQADRDSVTQILNRWKQKQAPGKPWLILLSTSGGGNRSAVFTCNMLHQLDSATNGAFLQQTALITGASGGMLGAAYFRQQWYERKISGKNQMTGAQLSEAVGGDLLNAIFSSFVSRDIFSPAQKFYTAGLDYRKDRAYAFEEAFNSNTKGLLNHPLGYYTYLEASAQMPMLLLHAVVTRDGRKLLIAPRPMRFMMRPAFSDSTLDVSTIDAVDYTSFFHAQEPLNTRMLTALRMNATFPIVLPNVWLPSSPVIDVMDAGMRDNYGLENIYRFVQHMDEWISVNCAGVAVVQIRDRAKGGWDAPYVSENLDDHATKPLFLLQNNWFKIMEYNQDNMLSYLAAKSSFPVKEFVFEYAVPEKQEKAAMNFHLTKREQKLISSAVQDEHNRSVLTQLLTLLNGHTTNGNNRE